MVDAIRAVFETNRFILYAVYGQVFFVMGLATALRYRRHSQLPLARHLWLLALFGLGYALAEWGHVFVPVQETYLPPAVTASLWTLQVVLLALSCTALLQFGLALLEPRLPPGAWLGLPVALFLLWGLLSLGTPLASSRTGAEALARYLLALPGGAVAAFGLALQVRSVARLGVPRLATSLRLAAATFAAFAVLGGALAPPAPFPPASVVNATLVDAATGVPVPAWLSLCGLLMALFVVRSLEAFHVEMDRVVAAVEREQALAADRARISRELHDGLIQTLYATGLALEDVDHRLGEDAPGVRPQLRAAMATLNETIARIRHYLLELSEPEEGLDRRLARLVEEFAAVEGPRVVLEDTGRPIQTLTAAQVRHLARAAREALHRAVAHDGVSTVTVRVTYDVRGVQLVVSDDGAGRAPADEPVLRDLEAQARALGAVCQVQVLPERGTLVVVDVPYPGAPPSASSR